MPLPDIWFRWMLTVLFAVMALAAFVPSCGSDSTVSEGTIATTTSTVAGASGREASPPGVNSGVISGRDVVVSVGPGDNIAKVIDDLPPGSSVHFESGVYAGFTLRPKDRMVLTAEPGAVLDGTGATSPFAIFGSARDVTIRGFEIRNYTKPIWGDGSPRHQGAIHGLVDESARPIDFALNWTIEDNNIHHNAGFGIFPGSNFTIRDNDIYRNGVAGISGGRFRGGLIEGNDIFENNHEELSNGDFDFATGRPYTSAWSAAGIKMAAVNCPDFDAGGACDREPEPLVIRNNHVHDNRGVGIWCDIRCSGVIIEGNLVEDNHGVESIGIFYEISERGIIRDNFVRGHSSAGPAWIVPIEIYIWSSQDVEVSNNTVIGPGNAIVANARPREHDGRLDRLVVRDNLIATGGQATNVGVASDESSDFKSADIRFEQNRFDDLGAVRFWWTGPGDGGRRIGLDAWRNLGFTPIEDPDLPTVPPTLE